MYPAEFLEQEFEQCNSEYSCLGHVRTHSLATRPTLCETTAIQECKTKMACETFPTSIRTFLEDPITAGGSAILLLDRIGKQTRYAFSRGGKVALLPPADKVLIQDAYRAWLAMIQAYSTCKITRARTSQLRFLGSRKNSSLSLRRSTSQGSS